MKKERSVHQLYKVLWENIKNKEIMSGLCSEMLLIRYNGKFSGSEYDKLNKHFLKQKPRKYFIFGVNKKFISHPSFLGEAYWWRTGNDGEEQRRLFVQHLINKTS